MSDDVLSYELLKAVERLSEAVVGMNLSSPWLTMEEAEARTKISQKTLFSYAAKGRLAIGGSDRVRVVHRDHLDDQVAMRFPLLPKGSCSDYIPPAPMAARRGNPAPEIAAPDGMYSRLRNTDEILAGCGVKKYQKKLQGEEHGKKNGRGRGGDKKNGPQSGERREEEGR